MRAVNLLSGPVKRDRSRPHDIREKAIKLTINSVYGQLARSVGTIGRVPFAANPYYAAAITAHIRRRLMEAALLNPHAIVFFATDGIVATEELPGLSRVRRDGDDIDLGDWEYYEADSGLFVMSGVYTYGKVKTDKNGVPTIEPVSKLRGADPKKYTREMAASAWLIRETLSVWRLPADQAGESANILSAYKKYITAGNALASPRRWKLAGRWSPPPGEPEASARVINVSDPGGKRRLLPHEPDWRSTKDRPANRCNGLIRTAAAWNDDSALSRPRMPDWLDADREAATLDQEEQAAIACGFG